MFLVALHVVIYDKTAVGIIYSKAKWIFNKVSFWLWFTLALLENGGVFIMMLASSSLCVYQVDI